MFNFFNSSLYPALLNKNTICPLTQTEDIQQALDILTFYKRFNKHFKRTNKQGYWYIGDDRIQMTLNKRNSKYILTVYQEKSLEEFKSNYGSDFLNGREVVLDIKDDKYSIIQITNELRKLGLWQ